MTAAFYLNLALGGIVQGLVIAVVALSINLVFAVARFPNAAAGDFLAVGAYSAIALQAAGLSSIILETLGAVIVTAVVAGAAYYLVFRPIARRHMVASLVASVGLSFLIRYTITFFVGQDQYSFALPIRRAVNWHGLLILPTDLWLAFAALASLGGVFSILYFTPAGRRLRAVADNPELAQASGIRAPRVMLVLWLMVGALSAIGGVILGIKTVVVPEIGWNVLLPGFAAAILGGVGSLPGALVAGVVLGIVQELSAPFVGFTYKLAVSFVILVIVLGARPQGLFGRIESVR